MAKGEARFSGEGRSVHEFVNTPIPEDDYNLILLEDGLGVKKSEAKGPDAIPYINCRFAAEGTAAKEGQKDRLVFHMFFLSLNPGTDGVIMPDRGGQLVQFYRAMGAELDAPILTHENEDGSETRYLDPEPIMEQLKEWVDSSIRAHVVIEKERDKATGKVNEKAPGRNKVGKWLLEEAVEDEAEESPKATGTGGKVHSLKKKR